MRPPAWWQTTFASSSTGGLTPLQSNRPHPESGRHYYYRPKDKKTGQGLSLTLDTIRRHLEGEITIGLYAINPATQWSKWVAIDADYEDSLTDLLKLSFHLRQDGVESALENGRRGGHLWIFMAEPLLARDCRTYVCDLAVRLGIPVKEGRQREGIEVFPKHDALKPGRYGNAIRGPLGIHRGGHLWIFMADPLPARDCRIYVCGLALRLSIPVKGGKQRKGIEVFPKHDALKPGRYGNAIRRPLGIHRGAAQRFWFDGADEDIEKQVRYLNSLPKMTGDQLARLIAGKAIPPQLLPPEPKAEPMMRRHTVGQNSGSLSTSTPSSAQRRPWLQRKADSSLGSPETRRITRFH